MPSYDIDFDGALQPFTIEIGSDHLWQGSASVDIGNAGHPVDSRPRGATWVDRDSQDVWTNYGTEDEPNWMTPSVSGGAFPTYFQTAAPGSPQNGETWIRHAAGAAGSYPDPYATGLFRFDGDTWLPVGTVALDGDGHVVGIVSVGGDGTIVIERFVDGEPKAFIMVQPSNIQMRIYEEGSSDYTQLSVLDGQILLGGTDAPVVKGSGSPVDDGDLVPKLWLQNYIADTLGGGSSPDAPITLAPVLYAFQQFTVEIPGMDYDDGAAGVGATLTETDPTAGALVMDGFLPAPGDRIVVNTGDPTRNGIYVVTASGDGISVPFVLTRATDCDTVDKRTLFWTCLITAGNVFGKGYAGVGWRDAGTGNIDLFIAANAAYAYGFSTAAAFGSTAESGGNVALGSGSHVEGMLTKTGDAAYGAHAEGNQTQANGVRSHAEGFQTIAGGQQSHAEGNESAATGDSSHAEGVETSAQGTGSHAEGAGTTALGNYSHAEGYGGWAEGYAQHAHASGPLDSQYTRSVFSAFTGDDTPTTMHDGGSGVYQLRGFGWSAHLRAYLIARTADGTTCVWEGVWAIHGDGSSTMTAFTGGLVKNDTLRNSPATDDWEASAECVDAGMQVQVTGVAATSIAWTLVLEACEVGSPL